MHRDVVMTEPRAEPHEPGHAVGAVLPAGEPTRHRPISGAARIAREIGTEILSGTPPPGGVLPSEIAFCARFGASRSVVREALKTVAAKGLIEARRRAGTRVRPRRSWQMLDAEVLSWRLASAHGEAKFATDLLHIRAVVEPAAAALAASQHSPEALAEIEAAFADMVEAAHDRALFAGPDLRFHEAILAATGNDAMVAFGALIEAALALFLRISARHPGAPGPSVPLHEAVLHAIRRRDPEAAQIAMLRLLDTTSRNVERNTLDQPAIPPRPRRERSRTTP